jgi:hypothetical protein
VRARPTPQISFLGSEQTFPAVKEHSTSGLSNQKVAPDRPFENTATVNFCISRKH